MPKRRAKRTVKQPSGSLESNSNCVNAVEPEIQKKGHAFIDHEVERQITACQAIRDVEVEHLLTGLHLLRSNFNKEQLQMPVLQFFKENMPNLTLKKGEKDGQFEVEWNDKDGNLSISHADERNMHTSLLRQMSVSFPNCAAALPPIGGFEFSSKAGLKTELLGAANLHIPDFVMEEPSETQMLGLQNAFQTPGASSHRLSVGMTPKTLRVPKHGEMLLSVRGSPLGVYKEDNMEAIDESEEG